MSEWQAQLAATSCIQFDELVVDPLEIGRGSFKTVYKAFWHSPGTSEPFTVAVLKIRSGSCEAEAKTLIKLRRHPRLIRFHGVCIHDGLEHIITEYAHFGALVPSAFDTIENRGWDISPGHNLAIMQQVCSGMKALAADGVTHCDLAGRNVLLFAFDPRDAARTSAKVSGFGLAVSTFGATCRLADSGAGSISVRHMAPEALEHGRFSERSDVWAMGVLCWEVLTRGLLPFNSCGLVIPDEAEARPPCTFRTRVRTRRAGERQSPNALPPPGAPAGGCGGAAAAAGGMRGCGVGGSVPMLGRRPPRPPGLRRALRPPRRPRARSFPPAHPRPPAHLPVLPARARRRWQRRQRQGGVWGGLWGGGSALGAAGRRAGRGRDTGRAGKEGG